MSINLGNGRLDTGIRNRVIRFDDDVWHNVVITRVAQKVIMNFFFKTNVIIFLMRIFRKENIFFFGFNII